MALIQDCHNVRRKVGYCRINDRPVHTLPHRSAVIRIERITILFQDDANVALTTNILNHLNDILICLPKNAGFFDK